MPDTRGGTGKASYESMISRSCMGTEMNCWQTGGEKRPREEVGASQLGKTFGGAHDLALKGCERGGMPTGVTWIKR